ncbi:trafficking protein particle complex subunit 10-like [Sinocyclocheilus rhinocerous]|uniref:trafficking protein particle complex subunit 10-like n=1 Tax=Sinocyclocheilus rhinocerous TaxID=307959 RepID=UPI0007B8B012|nr:PREDICTED: trafficking protein particle complex subunit 10-like [Sinocyclocheilus rhinocerous]
MEPHEEKPIIYTMENKPIVTSLTQQLPREPMEWRRSYGRAPKMIYLEANFVQFKEELLPKEGNKALLTFPFLHIYWTDCFDSEVYKASVKEDMQRWQAALRLHGSVDWLIAVVESDNKKKNKTNLLPRTSIVDKIRSDFCNKQSDRCVSLCDPLKESSRSQESWSSFLTKLRTLLLMSFTRNLGRFEDEMRTLREKRTEPGWSFCDYFMVQEELAFVFEMLQQFEDALVQYDELDALFTQYVLNFGAGDGANWLGSFCQPVRSWNGLLLRRPIDMEKRDLIQRGEASLLDLRSYLFSRQCTLLIFLQRPWEVTARALELLHNCVQELRLLEVSVVSGALDCWVFLSCLEVLHRIEGCCDRSQLEANTSHTVGLWTYATEKLRSLGDLCGLVSENGPNSEDLNKTVDLLAGLGAERPETGNYDEITHHFPLSLLYESQKPGVYTLRQLCATLGQVQFILPHLYPVVQYEVYSQEPQLSIQPLTAGVQAAVCVQRVGAAMERCVSRLSALCVLGCFRSCRRSGRGAQTLQIRLHSGASFVIDNNSNWAVCGKSSGVVSMPVAAMATHKVHMEVMPLFAGHLPFPNIRVFKYLPHHSSPVIPPDTVFGFSCINNRDDYLCLCLCLCVCVSAVIDNNSNWAVCGKSSGVVSMPVAAMATHKVHMEVMPLFAGHLPFPNIRVFKYLPHHSSPVIPPDTDSCLENDSLSLEDQAETASLRSRGSVQSLGSGESAQPRGPMPKRQAFGPGQVFSSTQGQQVLVLPSADHHLMEVNVT